MAFTSGLGGSSRLAMSCLTLSKVAGDITASSPMAPAISGSRADIPGLKTAGDVPFIL